MHGIAHFAGTSASLRAVSPAIAVALWTSVVGVLVDLALPAVALRAGAFRRAEAG